MPSSLSDILTTIQQGVVALNNLGIQIKGSLTNISGQLANGFVTSIATRTGAFTLNATSGITNLLNDIILSPATSAQFGAVKVDGTTITAAAGVVSTTIATQADQEASSSLVAAVTPGRQQFHPSAGKAWALVTQAAGTYTLSSNYNVTSITKNGTGDITVTFTVAFSSANFCCVATASGGNIFAVMNNRAAGTAQVLLRTIAGASIDTEFTIACFGDQP